MTVTTDLQCHQRLLLAPNWVHIPVKGPEKTPASTTARSLLGPRVCKNGDTRSKLYSEKERPKENHHGAQTLPAGTIRVGLELPF